MAATNKKMTDSNNEKKAMLNSQGQNDLQIDAPSLSIGKHNSTIDSPPPFALVSMASKTNSSMSFMNGTPSTTTKNQPTRVTPEERERAVREFVKTNGLNFTCKTSDANGQLSAKRLMSPDYSWSPTQEKRGHSEMMFREQWGLLWNMIEFDKELKNAIGVQEWKSFAAVFFEEKALDSCLGMHQQRAGVGFMHAITVFQHCLWCVRTGQHETNHKMLL